MKITEEQKRRAEANRIAAIEKRKRVVEAKDDVWNLFRCKKNIKDPPRFKLVLEICSPDEFSILPQPLPGSPFPGEEECFRKIESHLADTSPILRCFQSQVGRKAVFRLDDYETVLGQLKKFQGTQVQDIPYKTRIVVEKFASSSSLHHWSPFLPDHLTEDEVGRLISGLPEPVRESLLPFQLEGVRFGLRRGGRCLIADEMGLGKTLQAIAIASCFMSEGSVLVVCPAVLRYSWAEELERWLPLVPSNIHLVFGRRGCLDRLGATPKVVVISFKMLHLLRSSIARRRWAVVVVDESHKIRCTKKKEEAGETEAVLDVAGNASHVVLLSGTPSLTRPFDIFHQVNILWPGLLGKDKYEFAGNYCSPQVVRGINGILYKDFSRGTRLEELNMLLTRTVMIRRLKEHVLTQLPPKRRQIIRLKLKDSDVRLALAATDASVGHAGNRCDGEISRGSSLEKENCSDEIKKDGKKRALKELSVQELGIAKISGFCEWFSDHITVDVYGDACGDDLSQRKMIIFSHHIRVLDGLQGFLCEKGIKFVRIDGSTSARDRKVAVETFRTSKEVKVVIIGITAGGVGLDFSSAQSVVFLELPKSASEMLQAEDRAHRRGQTNAVNIYIFCAKDTSDESHWLQLNRSLYRVSSMVNGKVDAIRRIEVDNVSYLDSFRDFSQYQNREAITDMATSSSTDKCGPIVDLCNEYDPDGGEWRNTSSSSSAELDFHKSHSPNISSDVQNYSSCDNLDGNCSQHKAEDIISASNWNANDEGGTDRGTLSEVMDFFPPGRMNDSMVSEHEKHVPIQVDSLRFEVSQFTGRIHLYVCNLQTDSRPKPLFENFHPGDLESMAFSLNGHNKTMSPKKVKQNPAFWDTFQAFVGEWNNLRPIERNKLLGRPLQLPLHFELCYLKESINHEGGGLLKGGSKRRVTPWSEICNNLPPDASWRKISLRFGSKKETVCIQAWSTADEPLCKLCQSQCVGKLAKVPQYFEDLFCNLDCFQEYRLRTSGRFLRDALFQLEHGVCTSCKLDCHKLVQQLKPLSIERRRILVKDIAPRIAGNENVLEKIIHEPTEGNAWHADHIVPVYKGGGECRLENMRTLCVACHSDVTRAQQADRQLTRMRAKQQLKTIMKDLKGQKMIGGGVTEGGQEDKGNTEEEDDLLVQVPGSSYSKHGNGAD